MQPRACPPTTRRSTVNLDWNVGSNFVSGIIGALVGGFFSGPYQHLRDFCCRPRLKIIFTRDEEPFRIDTPDEIFIRVGIKNVGRRVANGAQAFLTSVEEIEPGSTIATKFYDSKPLAWAGWSFERRDLPPSNKVCFYADVLKISKHTEGWNFAVQNLLSSQASMTKFAGTYRFHIALTADNARAASCKINITYRQNWNTLRAVPVRRWWQFWKR